MKTKQAIRHFGSQAQIARILGISAAAVSYWATRPDVKGKTHIVPFRAALRLVRASEGELAIGLKDYE